MSQYRAEDLRNIVLVGHGGVGKTTLADRMLFVAGVGTRAGSVDDGTSLLDVDDEAKQHHFSISSAMGHFEHHGARINMIDTPGYPDFVGQAISALCAAETALVCVNASAGVEANTRRTFELAGKAGLARLVVLNRLDLENLDFPQIVESLRAAFGAHCVPLNVPDAVGSGFSRVISTIGSDDPQAARWGTAVMEAIVEADEELMEKYLDGQELAPDEILACLTKAIARGTLIPILCVSSRTGVGVPELMDAIADFALSPGELVRTAMDDAGDEIPIDAREDAPLVARVFKTRIDPFVSKMSFIRVLSGRLRKDDTVRDVRTGHGVRIHQLLDVQGGRTEPIDEAHAGDVVVVAKVDEFQVGDTLVTNGEAINFPPISFPSPMVGLAVEPKSRADQSRISAALSRIEEEDPTFHLHRDPQTHELVMQGMSELHLQVVTERLHQRDKVDVVTHTPRIPYRETILGEASGSYRHKKQSGGAGQFAEVHLRVTPLPDDLDPETYFTRERFEGLRSYHYDPTIRFAFVDCVSGGSVPNQFIPAVEKGVRDRLEQGIFAGYPMQGLAVSLFFGKDHPVDSNETAFRTAAGHCLDEVCRKANPALLEPVVHLSITAPGDCVGDISSDLSGRRGRIEGIDTTDTGMSQIDARAPLSEISGYARALSGITGGQGLYTLEFSHYEMAPPQVMHRVLEAAKG